MKSAEFASEELDAIEFVVTSKVHKLRWLRRHGNVSADNLKRLKPLESVLKKLEKRGAPI